MEYFLEQIETVLPVVGMDFLRAKSMAGEAMGQGQPTGNRSVALQMIVPRHDIDARAEENDGEFVVLRGSRASRYDGHASNQYAETRRDLIERGILRREGAEGPLIFAEDTVFRSPSEAAAVLLNRNANGRTEWKLTTTGDTLKAWQEAQLGAS